MSYASTTEVVSSSSPSSAPADETDAPVKASAGRTDTMKAIVHYQYGSPDVLALREVPKPVVGDDEVLVRVRAAAANPADSFFMRGVPYIMRALSGLRKPKNGVLGRDVAGQVDAVGKDVTRFRPGDEVFANPEGGGFAEYTSVSEGSLELKPANLTFEQAAAVPMGALTALQGLRDTGKVQRGQKVLVIGASGGVGTFAVQIAKVFGADVTAVCSTRNVEMIRSLGADHVIDYSQEDFIRSGRKYDLILQLAGTRSPSDCRRALTSKGTLVQSSGQSGHRWIGPMGRIVKAIVLSRFVSQKLGTFVMKPNKEDLQLLKELIEAGKVKPVIDRTYSLSEVPAAILYLEEGHARGKVVIAV
jgi:NADPH:quinone reductase-like Zn-dependent oxidoreductase